MELETRLQEEERLRMEERNRKSEEEKKREQERKKKQQELEQQLLDLKSTNLEEKMRKVEENKKKLELEKLRQVAEKQEERKRRMEEVRRKQREEQEKRLEKKKDFVPPLQRSFSARNSMTFQLSKEDDIDVLLKPCLMEFEKELPERLPVQKLSYGIYLLAGNKVQIKSVNGNLVARRGVGWEKLSEYLAKLEPKDNTISPLKQTSP